jgi:hypothetical protein
MRNEYNQRVKGSMLKAVDREKFMGQQHSDRIVLTYVCM